MDNKQIWTIIVIALVIAVVVSIISANITGNVIRLNQNKKGDFRVYTTQEVDAKLKGSCQYVHYKDGSSTGIPNFNMTIMDTCQKFQYLPKAIVVHQEKILYNKIDCDPSYEIFSSTSDELLSYKTELANVKLGQLVSNNRCNNVLFNDGKSNNNFSGEKYEFYSGVLCCKG